MNYRKMTNHDVIGKCECCSTELYRDSAIVTEQTYLCPIEHVRKTIFKNRTFCRDCSSAIATLHVERLRDRVAAHRLDNEGGQLALFF